MLKVSAIFVVVLTLSTGAAVAQSENEMAQGQMMMKMQAGKQTSEADKGYMGAMMKMHQSMTSMEMTGDPTHDFVMMMIPHHQSAIDMAQVLVKEPNADPEIKTMAEKIIADQQKEIDQFNAWLEKHK
ncbi:MAG TPA: DUF305 domain-containing protein [Aestuariivirgaceae bacterium]|nr:DUF305 domain-containing protein [Aestuariivirgaceae bacterium]